MNLFYSILLGITMSLPVISFAQSEHAEHDHDMECGAHQTKAELAQTAQDELDWQEFKRNHKTLAGGEILSYPIKVHILRRSDGTGGLTVAELDEMLERLNEIYLDAKITFYMCGDINYIDDDNYYDYSELDETALAGANDVANVCNIYFCNSVTNDEGGGLCGYAYYPTSSRDRVFMDNGCAKNGSTLAHEMGHYFYLRHTHNGGDELVDGSNCSTAGDDLCDTPADPTLGSSNVDDNGCTYTGTEQDANGDFYNPDVTNIMSYAPRACRFSFSNDQLTRIRWAAENWRNDLSCPVTVDLDAKFATDIQYTCDGTLDVQFYDVSDGSITGWTWDFGDGSPTSNDQDPTHTYSTPGVYDVTLTITDGSNNSSLTKTSHIKVGTVSVPYTQDFESADALDDFKVNDEMRNYTTIESDAGNGGTSGMSMQGYADYGTASPYFRTPNSAAEAFNDLQNPYYKSKNILCVDATTLTTMTLEFDYQLVEYINDLYTNFRVLANGIQVGIYNPSGSTTSWTTESINLDAYVGQVVTITFEASNKYARDKGGSSTSGNATYIDNINITGTAATNTANFTVDETSGCTNTTFTFTDASSGSIATYAWDFGAGASPANATGIGPHTVTYSTEGTKTVSLTVDDGGGSNDTETKTNLITIDNTACTDCNGDLFGTAYLDNCSDCVGGNTGQTACTQDCNGEWGGTAYTDNCSDCVGGSTGQTACTQDCHGDWGGTAYIDGCSNCVGGNTGETPCATYCESTFPSAGSEYISNVSFNTIDNTSGDAATNGYEDYTAQSTSVSLNSTYNISVTINTLGNYTDHCEVYIDWNQDADFEDANEYYDLGDVTNETAGVLSTNITVPAGATIGSTRMRVTMMWNNNPGDCDADHVSGYGETEDYTINVTNNDCNGDPGGSAYLDNCGTCVGGNTGETACSQDCNGDWGGTAYTDNCSDCVGGNTGEVACTQDCNGDWGGTAYTDNCSDCVGGNTGEVACTQDCNGDWGGTAYTDNCSDCVGGNTGQTACTQDCNGDWGGTAYTDNCSDCVGGNTGEVACTQDCNGDWGGTAYTDNCSDCVGGNTGEVECTQDCNGDWGGTAATDVCGDCAGGNTGITPETDINNCVTGLDQLDGSGVKAYPNPFGSTIQVELEDGFGDQATVEIYTSAGQLIESAVIQSGKTVEVGGSLSAGVYQLKVYNDSNSKTISIVKF